MVRPGDETLTGASPRIKEPPIELLMSSVMLTNLAFRLLTPAAALSCPPLCSRRRRVPPATSSAPCWSIAPTADAIVLAIPPDMLPLGAPAAIAPSKSAPWSSVPDPHVPFTRVLTVAAACLIDSGSWVVEVTSALMTFMMLARSWIACSMTRFASSCRKANSVAFTDVVTFVVSFAPFETGTAC